MRVDSGDGFLRRGRTEGERKKIRNLANAQFANSRVTTSELQWALHELQRLMRSEMETRKFFSIPERYAQLFDDPYPMLKDVSDAFPDAGLDIREAYNCLVLDRNTAAVFHAMRVAEHGLRFLARKVGVKLTQNRKPLPINFATWDGVITGIRNKITAAHKMNPGTRRQAKLNYYSDMAERCAYMKDLWRNDLMHSRLSFNSYEASGALQRVAQFMQILANPYGVSK